MYSHAELEAIESASKNKNLYGDLNGFIIYVSCEPCMMCMGAILYEEFDKLVYAATLQDSNDNYCPEMITNIDELAKYSKNKIQIVKELHRDKAIEVLNDQLKLLQNELQAEREDKQQKDKLIFELNERLAESQRNLDQQQRLQLIDRQRIKELEERNTKPLVLRLLDKFTKKGEQEQ